MKISNQDQSNQRQPGVLPPKNALEWSVFGASLFLVLSVFSWLTLEALKPPATPPRLGVQVVGIEILKVRSVCEIEVRNSGQTTAQSVEVEAKSGKQTANFTLDFVPRDGKKSGFAVFDGKIEKREVVARVLGFS